MLIGGSGDLNRNGARAAILPPSRVGRGRRGQMMETDLILHPLDARPSACYFRPILEEEEQPP